MGEKGCWHLSKVVMGKPERILLCHCSLTSGWNKIGDRGCRHINRGGWLRVKGVGMGINQNNLVSCGLREEGCRAIVKQQEHLEWINCTLVITQVIKTKSEWPAPAS